MAVRRAQRAALIPFDLHIHDLDVIISLFGAPQTVACTSAGRGGQGHREQYRFQYGYPNLTVCGGARVVLTRAIPFTARWRLFSSMESGVRRAGA
jgi:predicted dehydrogenase